MKVYIHRRPDDLQRHYPKLTTLLRENQVTYVSDKGRILTALIESGMSLNDAVLSLR